MRSPCRRAAVTALGALAGLALVAALVPPLRAVALDGLTRSMALQLPHADGDLLVVLAIGTDEGPPHRPGDPLAGRADGIHLLVVDTRASRMTVVDIPRDVWIGGTKVNAHLSIGGPDRLESALEAWGGLAIDYWAVGSFWSLEQVTAGLGGLEVLVPSRMADRFSGSDLAPGFQRLDPAQALAFSRDRKSLPDGDIGRSRNQGSLLLTALQQMRNETRGDPIAVARIVRLFQRSTITNIPPGLVLPLAMTALKIEPTAVVQATINGPAGMIGGQSVIRAEPGEVFARLNAGQVGPP